MTVYGVGDDEKRLAGEVGMLERYAHVVVEQEYVTAQMRGLCP